MTTLTIELPSDAYNRLRAAAQHEQTTIEVLAREWILARSRTTEPPNERDRAIAALRAAGLVRAQSGVQQPLLSEPERAALAAQIRADFPDAPALSGLIIAERDGQ